MRFKLTLQIEKRRFGDLIPLNYQYECSAVIYRILSRSNTDYSLWLHENGFQLENGKQFKLFTFSRLLIPQFRIIGENMKILSDTIEWEISFLPERSTHEFIQGVFKEQTFEIGNKNVRAQFRVNSVELLAEPIFSEIMQFETLSPICLTYKQPGMSDEYVSLEHPNAVELVKLNILSKYKAFTGNDFSERDYPFKVTPLSKSKATLITIKANTPQSTKVRGFMCQFELEAPIELMKLMYNSGIGGKNSLGFGMVKEMKKTD